MTTRISYTLKKNLISRLFGSRDRVFYITKLTASQIDFLTQKTTIRQIITEGRRGSDGKTPISKFELAKIVSAGTEIPRFFRQLFTLYVFTKLNYETLLKLSKIVASMIPAREFRQPLKFEEIKDTLGANPYDTERRAGTLV